MGVDLLIVRKSIDWRERDRGRQRGCDDVRRREYGLLSDRRARTRRRVGVPLPFQGKQVGLSDNLMNFDTFLKRGAKWLTAQELAMEGMQKMIKEFGL